MSDTTSAPPPQPAAAPAATPTATAAIDSPPPPQPGAVPQPPAFPEATPAPDALPPVTSAQAEPTPGPEPTHQITSGAGTTAEAVPEPTPAPSETAPISEPTVTSQQASQPTAPVAEPASTPVVASVPAATPTITSSTSPMATEQPSLKVISASPSDKEAVPTETKAAVEEVPEPENALTKKFTEREWTALKEFRAQLPDIFAEAYPDNPSARTTSVKFWGIEIDPSNPKADARVSVVLMKFLRANDLHVAPTREKLIGTLRWRESFNISAALEEDFPKDIFENCAHIFGRDKEERPIVYNIYGGNQDLKAVFGDVQRFIRWRVALMEKSVGELDFIEIDQMIQVHDYEGVSLTSRDANSKAAASEATNIFQNHYPELLFKKFFINVPTLLNWIFWLFKPLISANTLAKMSVVGTGQHTIKKALVEYVDIKELPKRYGGEAEAF